MAHEQDSAEAGKRDRCWRPFGCIALASAAAHLWCLKSRFYMDDMSQIRDNDIIREGHFMTGGLVAWTQFWQTVQYKLFGMSPVAFHAGNWILHTAVACVLYAFGRDLTKGRPSPGIAFFGALLFAVHPLGSEIPNYARTQDLAWVTLFSLLAAWAMLLFIQRPGWELVPGEEKGQIPVFQRTGRWWKLVLCALAVAGATFSKGPGLFHAMMAVGVVWIASLPGGLAAAFRRWWWIPVAGFALILLVAKATNMFDFGLNAVHQWQEPRFIGHAYTVSRVFWEFSWRSVVPVALSSDHHIAETLIPSGTSAWNIPDRIAMLAAAGMLGMAALGLWLALREKTRVLGICLSLYVGSILFRVLYLIPEFMPEYRIYPGLPWLCLGIAVVMGGVWKWFFGDRSPRPVAVVLLALLAILSARRSFLWHDLDRLTADVLRQYPAQARAIWELQSRDIEAGAWQAVVDRQEQVFPAVREKFIAELRRLAPARELPTGHFSLAEVASSGLHARAVGQVRGHAEAIRLINGLEAYMVGMKIDPLTNPNHWSYFKRDKALVLEAAGQYEAAAECLRREDDVPLWPKEYERISKKAAAAEPQP